MKLKILKETSNITGLAMYTINELIQNPSFRRMVHGTASPDEIDTWSKWIEESGENRQKAKIATRRIAVFRFKDPEFPDVEKKWDELYKTTIAGGSKPGPDPQKLFKKRALPWIFRAAAALVLISMTGIGVYLLEDSKQTTRVEQVAEQKNIRTGEGEQASLRFSNGAKIVLNSNSALSYTLDLLHSQTIQVDLEGKAYFESGDRSTYPETAFSITTRDGVIEDIGTSFTVNVEESLSRVVLSEGRVEVRTENDGAARAFNAEEGEMIEFTNTQLLKREKVNATFYTSWATGSMEFDQTEIGEFAQFVEREFGLTVQFADPDLSEIKIHGAIYYQTIQELVRTVSDITDVPIYQNVDTLYIGDGS